MRIKKWTSLMAVILFAAFIISAANAEADMDAFAGDVIVLQNQKHLNASWTAETINPFISLLRQYGLYEKDDVAVDAKEWDFFSDGLRYAYEQAWGDSRLWNLKQQYRYAVLEQQTGVEDKVLESFPGEGDLFLDEARKLARKEIREMGDTKGYDGDAIDFDSMIEQYHFWDYKDGDVNHTWVFTYYQEDIDRPIYRVDLYDNGARPNVHYYDVNNMDNVYTRWRAARNQQTFFDWPVEDKYAFNQALLALYDYQIDTYGELTKTAKFVFQYQYVLPREGMITQNSAIAVARNALAKQENLSSESIEEMRVGVFLFTNDENQTVYGIGFAVEHSMLYRVDVDAYDAKIVSITD